MQVVNDSGQVALKNYPPHQVLVQNTPSGSEYLFAIRADIALSFVEMQDVENILGRKPKKECCPGAVKYRYMYASKDDVRRWQNNGGR